MKKTPLLEVKEKFGKKEKLVDELMNKIKRSSDTPKDEFKKKLLAQNNKKLLKLLVRENTVAERFGNRDKLIDSILAAEINNKKKEDKGYRKKLESATSARLLELSKKISPQ